MSLFSCNEIIGRGTQGAVYAYHSYAVKVVTRCPKKDILQKASDAGVSPKYYGTYNHNDKYYIVHERLPTPFEEKFRDQITELVTRCIEAGIDHGDLNTTNMLADASGNLKLIDFDRSDWVRLRNTLHMYYADGSKKVPLVFTADQMERIRRCPVRRLFSIPNK